MWNILTFQSTIISAKENSHSRYGSIRNGHNARKHNLSPPCVVSRQSPVYNVAFSNKQINEKNNNHLRRCECNDASVLSWTLYLVSLWEISDPHPFAWKANWNKNNAGYSKVSYPKRLSVPKCYLCYWVAEENDLGPYNSLQCRHSNNNNYRLLNSHLKSARKQLSRGGASFVNDSEFESLNHLLPHTESFLVHWTSAWLLSCLH